MPRPDEARVAIQRARRRRRDLRREPVVRERPVAGEREAANLGVAGIAVDLLRGGGTSGSEKKETDEAERPNGGASRHYPASTRRTDRRVIVGAGASSPRRGRETCSEEDRPSGDSGPSVAMSRAGTSHVR